jgi:hypothetical protein
MTNIDQNLTKNLTREYLAPNRAKTIPTEVGAGFDDIAAIAAFDGR